MHQIRTDHQAEKFIEEQIACLGIARADAGHVVGAFLNPLLNQFLGKLMESGRRDTPEAITDDLQELQLVQQEERVKFLELLRLLKDEITPKQQEQEIKRASESGVLPMLRGVGTTVELKGVRTENFHWGDSIDTYTPNFSGVVPIVSAAIVLDSGTPDRFTFQMTSRNLEDVLDSLQAARRDLVKLEEAIQLRREEE